MSGAARQSVDPDRDCAFWQEPAAASVAAAQAPLAPCCGTLLVVDDVAMNRDVLGAFLRDAGYSVHLADGGHAALRLASERSFDLILMDVRMPGMDGLEATRRIRTLPGRYGKVPMVALSSYSFSEQVAQCRLAGMDGHVAKPVDYATLINTVAQAISHDPSCWPDDRSDPPIEYTEEAPPLRLDQALLDKALGLLTADQIFANLESLRVRKEQMVRLLDQPAESSLLTDAAHALGSAAGMFGFTALSAVSRSFERAAMIHDAAGVERLARELRTETCAALAALDELLDDFRMGPSMAAADKGHGVIVVEDDPLVRTIIRAMLRYAKQQVFLAADGLEAVVLAGQFKARLVLLDISMPGLSGLLACEAIRAQPSYADVPIVILSGHGDDQMQQAARRLGATDFVTKPFRPDVLLARLALHVDLPARPLRGVFPDVPAAPTDADANNSGDRLRGGWLKSDTTWPGGSPAPLKGLRHNLEGVFLYAGIPPALVQKWLGYARPSPVSHGCDESSMEVKDVAARKPRFLN